MSKASKALSTIVFVSFLLGSNEFIVLGISSELAHNFNVSANQIGSLTTIYAVIYAIFIVILIPLTSALHNFKRLIWFVVIFASTNILTAISFNYYFFAFSRIASATIVGTINSLLIAFISKVAPEGKETTYLVGVFTGISLASVLGVPCYSFLTGIIGWRILFALIGGLSLLSVVMLSLVLPHWDGDVSTSISNQYAVFRDSEMLLGIAVTGLSVAAVYSFYTYLEPFLRTDIQLNTTSTSLVLGIFGLMSLFSNHVSSWLQRRFAQESFPRIFLIIIVCFIVAMLVRDNPVFEVLIIIMFGTILYLIGTPATVLFINISKRNHPAADVMGASIYPIAFNVGISLGSMTGGAMLEAFNFDGIFFGGLILAMLGLPLSMILVKKIPA